MVFSLPFQRFPTSKVALMHPQGQSVDQKARHVLGPGTWDWFFLLRMRFHSLYFDILCTYGSKIDPTFKSRMYRMFLSFQNLDGNIYSWNLYVYVCFPNPRMVPEWGKCCSWLWRSLRIATISAWKVKAVFVERFWLNGFIEEWWIKYEKLWFI